jgi:hypothetical protein
MISTARFLGAPVIEPPGDEAIMTLPALTPPGKLPGNRTDQVMNIVKAVEAAQLSDLDRARLTEAT